jgi:beta-lactamase regulating signal transducer with metallopeptidase domain
MTILPFVAEWAFRSSIVILGGAALLRLLRVKDPSIRLAGWISVLCASLAMPLLTAELPVLPVMKQKPAHMIEIWPPAVQAVASAPQTPSVPPRTPVRPSPDWRRIAILTYSIVAIGLLLRLCAGIVMSLRILRASRATGRLADNVEVLESDQVTVPVTLGVMRPAIVLPADWRDWDEVKFQAVVAHETSHIRRRDPLVQLVSALHRALLWLTPLSWYLHRQIVRVAEEASDDAAVAALGDRESYAGILLEFMAGVKEVSWQGVAMARCGRPEQRIRRVLDGKALSRGLSLGSTVAIVALASPLAYVAAAARPQPEPVPIVVAPPQPAAGAQVATSTAPAPASAAAPTQTPPIPSRATGTTESPATVAAVSTQEPATAQPSSGTIRHYIVVQGDSMSGSWDSDSEDANGLRQRYGDNFAWFRQNEHEFLVTDATVMAQLTEAMQPQRDVDRMQADVNKEQSQVNGLQGNVNAHQKDVNALQDEVNQRQNLVNELQASVNRGDNATLMQKLEAELKVLRAGKPEAYQNLVNQKQSEVNREQADVNAEQSKVNAMQQKVNEEQHRVSAEFNRQMQEILDSAVRSGAAKEIR